MAILNEYTFTAEDIKHIVSLYTNDYQGLGMASANHFDHQGIQMR